MRYDKFRPNFQPAPPAPEPFVLPARFRGARWEDLCALQNDDGRPRVTLSGDRGARAVELRQKLLGKPRAVIWGSAGHGKTTVACAWLRGSFEADTSKRCRFIPAVDLVQPDDLDRRAALALAMSADFLALDDLGAELDGVSAASGLAAQRIGPASRLIADRFDRSVPTVITTGLGRDAVAAIYGDRVARRAYEGAAVIRLGGAS